MEVVVDVVDEADADAVVVEMSVDEVVVEVDADKIAEVEVLVLFNK